MALPFTIFIAWENIPEQALAGGIPLNFGIVVEDRSFIAHSFSETEIKTFVVIIITAAAMHSQTASYTSLGYLT